MRPPNQKPSTETVLPTTALEEPEQPAVPAPRRRDSARGEFKFIGWSSEALSLAKQDEIDWEDRNR